MRDLGQKIVLVTRPTRLEELTRRYNTRGQARFLIQRSRENFLASRNGVVGKGGVETADAEFTDVEAEHEAYQIALQQLRTELELGVKVMPVDRMYLPNFVFGPQDIVVTLGQDGLVANTAKYALDLPIIAVNPDPRRIDGVLLPFRVEQARSAVRNVLESQARFRRVTLAEALLNNGQRLLAFNDLFIGNRTHVSARYRLELRGQSEAQSSSGLLVSTGAGSTGWLSSVFNMAAAVGEMSARRPEAATPRRRASRAGMRMSWDDRRLVFVVREPFVSRSSGAELTVGVLEAGEEVIIESQMSQNGVIFSDGIEADYLDFASGVLARVRAAKEQARLVVPA